MDIYRRVRLAWHHEGLSQREAARRFGIDRRVVSKILKHSTPPGYQRSKPPARPRLDGFTEIIDQILKGDKKQPGKQRHSCTRIFKRLRDEHGFEGGLTIVTDYIREQKQRTKEVFVPLSHAPGHAQADFGEAWVIIGGVKRKAHYFTLDFPHSDAGFAKAYPAETTEAFCDGHVSAFAFFGGIPQSILFDNTSIAVAKIKKDGTRVRTETFGQLQSHYLFEDRFGRPGKGNDKGKVEGLVGYVRRNYFVPIPEFESFDALNAWLEEQYLKRYEDLLRGHTETIGERLERDLDALMNLPVTAYDACEKVETRASSTSMVRYRCNDYSVPVAYAHSEVQIRGYIHDVTISSGAKVIARHNRSYDKADMIFNPLHYLALLEKKVGALDQAAPLKGWNLPKAFETLRQLLETRMGKKGKREYVQVLRLMESFDMPDVHGAVKQALNMGAIGYDAVKHLVLCRIDKRPPKLDMDIYPYLPKANVEMTRSASYMALLHQNSVELSEKEGVQA